MQPMNIPLPEEFKLSMRATLGEEAEALFAALDREPLTSIRHNPAKRVATFDGEVIGWSSEGRYLAHRPQFTLDPLLHGGAYYVQEASSQFLSHLLAGEPLEGCRILDMCAAPGGKTTIYSTLVGRSGLVVANDISRSRCLALADNVQRWGMGNVVVTNNEPRHIAAFEEWFDVVAVDAPCSGEGMFRKMEEARTEWSSSSVEVCAERQREILAEAWRTLRHGGVLLYSTCTFNAKEDEGIVEWLMEEYGEDIEPFAPVTTEECWGIARSTIGHFQCFHFYPHRAAGEGFFVAVARKRAGAVHRAKPKARRKLFAPVSKGDAVELGCWVNGSMAFRAIGESIYGYDEAVVEDVTQLSELLSVIYSGVAMGQIFKGKLRPDHALALYVGLAEGVVPRIELAEEEALTYLRRGDIAAAQCREGFNAVCFRGVPIGFVKRIGARCNNMLPKDLRIMKL